jgi:hypothetical protein
MKGLVSAVSESEKKTMCDFQKKTLLFALIIWAGLMIVGPEMVSAAREGERTIVATGTGRIIDSDTMTARKNAIKNGLVAAVESTAVNHFPSDFLKRNLKSLKETLYQNPQNFVTKYQVMTESKTEKTYKVVVKATVSLQRMEASLVNAGVVKGDDSLPKILLLLTEQNVEDGSKRYRWGRDMESEVIISEAALAKAMRSRGFIFIDPYVAEYREAMAGSLKERPEVDVEDAVRLGASVKADLVVLADASVQLADNTMGTEVKSFKSSVNARVFRVINGDTITETTQTSVVANADEAAARSDALTQAAKTAGNAIAQNIVRMWQEQSQEADKVELFIGGTRNLKHFVEFRNALVNISGVNGIRMQEIKPNEAVLAVYYDGSTKKLARLLRQVSFGEFGINIFDVMPKQVSLELVAK